MPTNAKLKQLDTRQPKAWLERLARVGMAAKGTIYVILAVLSVMAAFQAGQARGSKSAIQTIGSQPFGQTLLILVVVGLLGYSAWRLVQCVRDPENKGTDAKGIVTRIGYAASAVAHVALAVAAFQLATGSGNGGGGAQTWVSKALGEAWGPWLIGAIGVGVVGAGVAQVYRAATEDFRKELREHQMSAREQSLARWSGRLGLAARGVVLPIIGVSLISAAVQSDPSDAQNVGGALRSLEQGGPWLLAAVALGLALYGVFQLMMARYRRVRVS